MHAPRYEETFFLKAKNSLGRFAPSTLPHYEDAFCLKVKNGLNIMAPCTHPGTSRDVTKARRPHTGSRPCAFEEKKNEKTTRNPAAPKTHHEMHSSPAIATIRRRRVIKHVPRVSPHSPASTDPGFVEIGLVQLSQSVKTTNVTHTHRHTD